jgi:hypothetical protein
MSRDQQTTTTFSLHSNGIQRNRCAGEKEKVKVGARGQVREEEPMVERVDELNVQEWRLREDE